MHPQLDRSSSPAIGASLCEPFPSSPTLTTSHAPDLPGTHPQSYSGRTTGAWVVA